MRGKKTYIIVVTLTVHDGTDEHLQTQRAIRGEVRSWLQGLNATVRSVTVQKLDGRAK